MMQMIPPILQKVRQAGYLVFEEGYHNANIVGVRSMVRAADSFDDTLWYCARDKWGHWYSLAWPVTTDPGLYYLRHPTRAAGTALLCAGQYRGSHGIGLHKGKYEALRQQKNVTITRDDNRDSKIDRGGQRYTGIFGINIHKSYDAENVGKYSAGCTVFKYDKDFDVFMALCRLSRYHWGNSFTYTLLEDT